MRSAFAEPQGAARELYGAAARSVTTPIASVLAPAATKKRLGCCCPTRPQMELLLDMVTLANLDSDKLSEELEQKENELSQR